MLGTVLGDAIMLCWLYLASKPSHVRVNVDGLACPCTIQQSVAVRRGDKASCQALPCPIVRQWGWHLSGGCKANEAGYLMEF
jgi:hypothetical protein